MNVLKNREDFKKWLLATSDYGEEIQEDLNAVVGYDENFNHAIVRHALDLKNEATFRNPNPLNVTFHEVKKFDLVNPVLGKLATQVKTSKLTYYKLTKHFLGQGETDKLQNRFELFKKGLDEIINDDKDDDENTGRGGGGRGGRNGGTPPRPPPDLYGENTPAENSRRIQVLLLIHTKNLLEQMLRCWCQFRVWLKLLAKKMITFLCLWKIVDC